MATVGRMAGVATQISNSSHFADFVDHLALLEGYPYADMRRFD